MKDENFTQSSHMSHCEMGLKPEMFYSFRRRQKNLAAFSYRRLCLHLKVRQMASQWDDLTKHDLPAPDEGNVDAQFKRLPAARMELVGTLIYGCVVALYVYFMPYWMQPLPIMVRLSIWLGLGGYSVLLLHWRNRFYRELFLPLWIAFTGVWVSISVLGYLFLIIGILVWIRSGDYHNDVVYLKILLADFILSYIGIILGVWLVQFHNLSPLPAVAFFYALQGPYYIFLSGQNRLVASSGLIID